MIAEFALLLLAVFWVGFTQIRIWRTPRITVPRRSGIPTSSTRLCR